MPALPDDYTERTYAGVLGKIIGVYLGRPFEGWSHARILAELGEVDRYVHERFGVPLVVTDDDISGTFTFPRALEDRDHDPALTPAQIGESWLNYLVENRTILWWGGMGTSTEHTAYLRLKSGIPAPESGSIARNGVTIAQQIGAQIFIDGWAMTCPGEPDRAADLARRTASVSHDGEAVYGAQVVAAIEAEAYVHPALDHLLDIALSFIPTDCTIARVIHDLREWHAAEPNWRRTRARIEERYNYDLYPGACHIVPNHAVVIHALLHGGDDFGRALMIAATDGWDTDCNAGNVGAVMGIRLGLAGIDAGPFDWRGPVADRMYLASAEGGRVITDAVRESVRIVNTGRAMRGLAPLAPKDGARFHFSLPGSVQGFRADDPAMLAIGNEHGRLALTLVTGGEAGAFTGTFIPADAFGKTSYTLMASPTLHPGQVVHATLGGEETTVSVCLALRYWGAGDQLVEVAGPVVDVAPGADAALEWVIPDPGGPIAAIGAVVTGAAGATVFIDRLGWSGAPAVTLGPSPFPGERWRRAWIDGVDEWNPRWPDPFHLSQNAGTGLIAQGTEEWADYRAEVQMRVPLAAEAGLAVRVGGMRRWYGLLLGADGIARLVREGDGRVVLAEAPYALDPARTYALSLEVAGSRLRGSVDGAVVLEGADAVQHGGGVGLVVREGTLEAGPVRVTPASVRRGQAPS